jgi:hypothetical protein
VPLDGVLTVRDIAQLLQCACGFHLVACMSNGGHHMAVYCSNSLHVRVRASVASVSIKCTQFATMELQNQWAGHLHSTRTSRMSKYVICLIETSSTSALCSELCEMQGAATIEHLF